METKKISYFHVTEEKQKRNVTTSILGGDNNLNFNKELQKFYMNIERGWLRFDYKDQV